MWAERERSMREDPLRERGKREGTIGSCREGWTFDMV